jgi:hypothetical protein
MMSPKIMSYRSSLKDENSGNLDFPKSDESGAESSVVKSVGLPVLKIHAIKEVPAFVNGFSLNDEVDALCTTANGAQRWFPGKVTSVNKDGTYEVTCKDGDILIKKAAEVRILNHDNFLRVALNRK